MRESRKYSYGAELQLKEMAFVRVTFASPSIHLVKDHYPSFGLTPTVGDDTGQNYGLSLERFQPLKAFIEVKESA